MTALASQRRTIELKTRKIVQYALTTNPSFNFCRINFQNLNMCIQVRISFTIIQGNCGGSLQPVSF